MMIFLYILPALTWKCNILARGSEERCVYWEDGEALEWVWKYILNSIWMPHGYRERANHSLARFIADACKMFRESISGVFSSSFESFKSTSIKYLSAPIKYLKGGVREFSLHRIAACGEESGRNLAFKKIEMQNLKLFLWPSI